MRADVRATVTRDIPVVKTLFGAKKRTVSLKGLKGGITPPNLFAEVMGVAFGRHENSFLGAEGKMQKR